MLVEARRSQVFTKGVSEDLLGSYRCVSERVQKINKKVPFVRTILKREQPRTVHFGVVRPLARHAGAARVLNNFSSSFPVRPSLHPSASVTFRLLQDPFEKLRER